MSPRKDRIAVVLDTNVLVASYLSKKKDSANGKVFLLWRTRRRLQLIVSAEVVDEYLKVLQRLGVPDVRISRLRERIQSRQTVTYTNLGGRPVEFAVELHRQRRSRVDCLLMAREEAILEH